MIAVVLPFPYVTGNHSRAPRRDGGWYVTAKARAYRQVVHSLTVRLRPLPGLVAVDVALYRGERNGRLVRADVDGAIKVLLDALQGRAYGNDSSIRRLIVEMLEDRERPRAEVLVTPYGGAPEK